MLRVWVLKDEDAGTMRRVQGRCQTWRVGGRGEGARKGGEGACGRGPAGCEGGWLDLEGVRRGRRSVKIAMVRHERGCGAAKVAG